MGYYFCNFMRYENLILILFFFSLNFSVSGQKYNYKKVATGGAFFGLNAESPNIDFNSFNSFMIQEQLPEVNFSPVAYGFNFSFVAKQFNVEVSLSSAIRERTLKSYTTTNQQNFVSINFGYDVLKKLNWSLFPYIGYRNTSLIYQVSENSDRSNVEDLISDNLDHRKIQQNQNMLDVGLGMSWQKTLQLSFRVGYQMPVVKEKWLINEHTVIWQNTNFFNQGFYFRIGIGIGGIGYEEICEDCPLRNRSYRPQNNTEI